MCKKHQKQCAFCEGEANTYIMLIDKGEITNTWDVCQKCKFEHESGVLKKKFEEEMEKFTPPDWFNDIK